jgi:3-deoxy-7-phosphoheptulonate synthase
MQPNATEEQIEKVVKYVENNGFKAHISKGEIQTLIGCVGGGHAIDKRNIELLSGVREVVKITSSYKLASRIFQEQDTIITVKNTKFGGKYAGIIAGPCTVESEKQMEEVAEQLSDIGITTIRGGAFKPRTSPYSFQGMGEEGLKILYKVAQKYNLAVISEVMEISQIPLFMKYVDILQVGARNMQNFNLLKELGKINKPVLIKRGLSATIEEWLMAAEYILSEGNREVMLCERGIRTFERMTRNTLDLSAIPVVKKISHLPVLVDPSHATGLRDKVYPMSLAAIAVSCDGLEIEVHPHPEEAICDGAQSLTPTDFKKLYEDICKIANVVNKVIQ